MKAKIWSKSKKNMYVWHSQSIQSKRNMYVPCSSNARCAKFKVKSLYSSFYICELRKNHRFFAVDFYGVGENQGQICLFFVPYLNFTRISR